MLGKISVVYIIVQSDRDVHFFSEQPLDKINLTTKNLDIMEKSRKITIP